MAFKLSNLSPAHVAAWLHTNAPHLVQPLLSHIANNPISNVFYRAAGAQGQIDYNSPQFIQHQNNQLRQQYSQSSAQQPTNPFR